MRISHEEMLEDFFIWKIDFKTKEEMVSIDESKKNTEAISTMFNNWILLYTSI